MKKFQTISTFIGGVLIGGILLGSLSMATAEDLNSKTNTISESAPVKAQGDFRGMGKMRGPGSFKGGHGNLLSGDTFAKLVTDKVITQQKADEIKAFTEKQELERTELREKMKDMRGNLFSQLVENKILTEKQAETIQAKLREEAQATHKEDLTQAVQGLVENKTITKVQSDKIIKQFDDVRKDREALFEKTKDMTPEERHQFMVDNKASFTNPIDALVKAGTITDEQAEELKEALPHKGMVLTNKYKANK